MHVWAWVSHCVMSPNSHANCFLARPRHSGHDCACGHSLRTQPAERFHGTDDGLQPAITEYSGQLLSKVQYETIRLFITNIIKLRHQEKENIIPKFGRRTQRCFQDERDQSIT